MSDNNVMKRNFVFTFFIGFVAGIAPFVFMRILPALLNPTAEIYKINLWPIFITGILVGIITAIFFSKTFQDREPQDIFLYALGIPAILIATVSNLSTEFSAMEKVSQTREANSAIILSEPEPETVEGIIEQAPRPSKSTTGKASKKLLSINSAWASDNVFDHKLIIAQNNKYYVVLKEYDNASEAWRDYDKVKKKRLRTERYKSSRINVLKLNDSRYILIYGMYNTNEEAIQVYKLLRINDPGFNVRLLKVQ